MRSSAGDTAIRLARLTAVLVGCLWCLLSNGRTGAAQPAGPGLREDARLEVLDSNGAVRASIVVEIADSPRARARGLMHRTRLQWTQGMFFIFESAAHQAFWMRNTPLALDIFFVGNDRRIFHIVRAAEPMSDRIYHSPAPARYVLEVPAGFADRQGIQKGHLIRWTLCPAPDDKPARDSIQPPAPG
jgi:uncharacterized membrane protein (UPF0127 family)